MGVPRTLAKGLSKLKEAAELRKLGGTQAERMARAAEQGYDTSRTLYHGGANDFDAFAESRRGVYLSDNPDIAGIYADNAQKRWPGQNNAEPNIIAGYAKGKPLVVSDQGPGGGGWLSDNMANALNVSLDDVPTVNRAAFLNDEARRQGYGYIEIQNMDDLGGNQTQIRLLDNSNFRSVNADFNPANRDSPNLLAGIAGAMPYAAGTAALLAGATGSQEAEAGPLQSLGRAAPYLTSAALGGAAALQSGDAEAGIITRGGRRLIEAWHGSPHMFDKFDISKIGTGEGNQSYGHGLYLADVKDDARQYMRPGRHQYTSETTIDGSPISRANPQTPVEAQAINALRRNPTIDEAVKYLQQDEGTEAAQAWLSENRQRIQDAHSTGLLYRTEIDVDPDTLLDYDKPLSEQSDHVRGILSQWQKDVGGSIGTGDGALKEIAFDRRMRGLDDSPQAVSQQLRDMGIPGIRYLDNQSRQAGEGTYNYVMFDDKPISIVERGNANPALLGATAVGTGAGMYAASDAEAGPLDALGRAAPYLATGALGAAMMTPQDAQAEPISIMPPTYDDTMQRTQTAIDKIDQFKAKRAGKRGAMDIMKLELQTMLKGANMIANDVLLPELEKADGPLKLLLGFGGVFGALAQGKSPTESGAELPRIMAQPADQTTYELGGRVTDTLSPYVPAPVAAGAGALTHAGALLASPF